MALVLTALARAQIVGTFSGVGTANDTITIRGSAYKFVADPTTTALEFEIGSTAAISCTNFCLAVNAGPTGSGTLWGSATTANAYVTATDNGDATCTIKARSAGVGGNAIVIAESGTGFSFAGAAVLLAGGVGQLEELIETSLTKVKVNMQCNAEIEKIVGDILLDLA